MSTNPNRISMVRGNGGRGNQGRGKARNGTTSSRHSASGSTTTRTNLTDYIYHVGLAQQAGDFVTVNDYLARHIKRTFDMRKDIEAALEELKPFDFDNVRPSLRKSVSEEATTKAIEDRQFELNYNIDYKAHKQRMDKYEENLVKAHEFLWDRCSTAMRAKLEASRNYRYFRRSATYSWIIWR